MAEQSLTMMRCGLCRAVLSSADAPAMIRAGTPCGVCGGELTLAGRRGRGPAHADAAPAHDGAGLPGADGLPPTR